MIKQLNLNPEVINNSLKVNVLDKKLKKTFTTVVLIIVLISAASLGINLFIIAKIKVMEISANKYDSVIKENKKLTTETTKMSNFITQIDNIKKSKTETSDILTELTRCVPEGGSIESYSIKGSENITLSYSSKDYDNITKFMKNVEDEKFFKSINVSSISSESTDGYKASVEIEVSSKDGEK